MTGCDAGTLCSCAPNQLPPQVSATCQDLGFCGRYSTNKPRGRTTLYENRIYIYSNVACLEQVDLVESIPLQVKPQLMSSNWKPPLRSVDFMRKITSSVDFSLGITNPRAMPYFISMDILPCANSESNWLKVHLVFNSVLNSTLVRD